MANLPRSIDELRKDAMLDVKHRIDVISSLVGQGTPESVTYAALECRLTIEYLCYERLQLSLDLASYADMKGWQPSKVVKAVEELVDDHITSEVTLSIAAKPHPASAGAMTLEDRQQLEYHPLGTQAALDLKKLSKLWNGLANSALHVQVPKLRAEQLAIYGSVAKTTEKVRECLAEFRKISHGTLLFNGIGPEVSISCDGCQMPIRRRVHPLIDKQTVSCMNPTCAESYTVEKASDDQITFERRLVCFECKDCGVTNRVPMREVEKIRILDVLDIPCCQCGADYKIGVRPFIANVNRDTNDT